MKLRNRKTGEVVVEINKIGLVWNKYGMPAEIGQYDSIAELNEEWEDYKPKGPLIKDEKIRKAVRAWADVNNIIEICYDAEWNAFRMDGIVCCFDYDFDRHDGLVNGCHYTIAELCGEDEE